MQQISETILRSAARPTGWEEEGGQERPHYEPTQDEACPLYSCSQPQSRAVRYHRMGDCAKKKNQNGIPSRVPASLRTGILPADSSHSLFVARIGFIGASSQTVTLRSVA